MTRAAGAAHGAVGVAMVVAAVVGGAPAVAAAAFVGRRGDVRGRVRVLGGIGGGIMVSFVRAVAFAGHLAELSMGRLTVEREWYGWR